MCSALKEGPPKDGGLLSGSSAKAATTAGVTQAHGTSAKAVREQDVHCMQILSGESASSSLFPPSRTSQTRTCKLRAMRRASNSCCVREVVVSHV